MKGAIKEVFGRILSGTPGILENIQIKATKGKWIISIL